MYSITLYNKIQVSSFQRTTKLPYPCPHRSTGLWGLSPYRRDQRSAQSHGSRYHQRFFLLWTEGAQTRRLEVAFWPALVVSLLCTASLHPAARRSGQFKNWSCKSVSPPGETPPSPRSHRVSQHHSSTIIAGHVGQVPKKCPRFFFLHELHHHYRGKKARPKYPQLRCDEYVSVATVGLDLVGLAAIIYL